VDKRSLAAEAQEAAAQLEAAEYVNFLRNLTKSADPNTREHAETQLELLTKTA
jgi:hypothetical protein